MLFCPALLSYRRGALYLIYGCLAVMGGAAAFNGPASSALVAQVIPERVYENAMTWRSSIIQLSSVLGPAAGGLLINMLHGAMWVYAVNGGAALVFRVDCCQFGKRTQQKRVAGGRTLRSLLEGLHFFSGRHR